MYGKVELQSGHAVLKKTMHETPLRKLCPVTVEPSFISTEKFGIRSPVRMIEPS